MGFRVWGLGCRAFGLGFRFRVFGLEFRVESFWCTTSSEGQGLGFLDGSSGFGV